jgi:hypothetical protein
MFRAVLCRMRVGSVVYRSTSDGRDLQGTGAQAELGHSSVDTPLLLCCSRVSIAHRRPQLELHQTRDRRGGCRVMWLCLLSHGWWGNFACQHQLQPSLGINGQCLVAGTLLPVVTRLPARFTERLFTCLHLPPSLSPRPAKLRLPSRPAYLMLVS